MEPSVLEILQRADDAVAWDDPKGWRDAAPGAIRRVRALVPGLEQALGAPLMLDLQVQDASFFAQLTLLKSRSGSSEECILAIRFSKFDRLFTVCPWSTSQPPDVKAATAVDMIASYGFTYVDPADLGMPYTGDHPGFRGSTWWVRYFDYV